MKYILKCQLASYSSLSNIFDSFLSQLPEHYFPGLIFGDGIFFFMFDEDWGNPWKLDVSSRTNIGIKINCQAPIGKFIQLRKDSS